MEACYTGLATLRRIDADVFQDTYIYLYNHSRTIAPKSPLETPEAAFSRQFRMRFSFLLREKRARPASIPVTEEPADTHTPYTEPKSDETAADFLSRLKQQESRS